MFTMKKLDRIIYYIFTLICITGFLDNYVGAIHKMEVFREWQIMFRGRRILTYISFNYCIVRSKLQTSVLNIVPSHVTIFYSVSTRQN